MLKYTIVGLYCDNNQTWIDTLEAPTLDVALSQLPAGVTPLAVFAGDLMPLASFDEADFG